MFEPVPMPQVGGADDPSAVANRVCTYLSSEPFRAVVEAFGGPTIADPFAVRDAVSDLVAFTDVWDSRQGQERDLANSVEIDDGTAALVEQACRALGMVDEASPSRDDYDHVLILGGLARACLLRPRHAAALVGLGLRTDRVTALGAFRPLSEKETAFLAEVGVDGGDSEFDVMDSGIRDAFGLGRPRAVRGRRTPGDHTSWEVRDYAAERSAIEVVAAPSTDPSRRANTADTFAFWAGDVALSEGDCVLVVTSAIYVPFQHLQGIRMLTLSFGAEVETIGVDTSRATGAYALVPTASNYLQELRSTVLAAAQLLVSIG